jgi:transcriptional regulator with XRE-family HTH domain
MAEPQTDTKPLLSAERDVESDLTPIVGANLRRLRVKRGLSLERLATASSVSRAMLGQIELGQSTPTINVLWKIARALDVPFSTLLSDRQHANEAVLLERSRAKILTSADGSFSSRALFPFDERRRVEFYELRLGPSGVERADAHPAGTTENLVVTQGRLDLRVGGSRFTVAQGDAVHFVADVPHEYRNPGTEQTVMYLVMSYALREP